MWNSNLQSRRHGFTLYEFLAVAAVLALGVTIFYRSHRNKERSNCQNNLKQISLAFKQYQNDFDGRCPLVAVTDSTTTAGVPPYGWADSLQLYIRNTEVYQCPGDNNAIGADTMSAPNFTDYWYNANLVRRINRGSVIIYTGAEMAMFGSTTQTVLAGDGGNTTGSVTGNARYNQCGDGKSVNGGRQVCATSESHSATYPAAQIHLNGANFAFLDGHVQWVKGDNASQSSEIMSNRATCDNVVHSFTFSILNH